MPADAALVFRLRGQTGDLLSQGPVVYFRSFSHGGVPDVSLNMVVFPPLLRETTLSCPAFSGEFTCCDIELHDGKASSESTQFERSPLSSYDSNPAGFPSTVL